jgi:hypothetical protein
LHAGATDQEDSLAIGLAETLVGNRDAVDLHLACLMDRVRSKQANKNQTRNNGDERAIP